MKFETLSKVLATLLVAGVWLCAHAQSVPEGAGASEPPEDATPPPELREDVANENSDESAAPEAEAETTAEEVSAPEPSEPSPMSFAALLKSSPFKSIAKNSIRGGSSVASNQIQFRGIIKIGNETEYGLYDPISQRSYWIKLRDRNRYGIYAESYDAKNKTLTIQSTATGKLSLALAKPDESPLAFSSNAAYRQASSGNTGFGRGGPQMNNRRGDMQQGQGQNQGQGSQQGQGQNQGQGQGQGQFQNRRGEMMNQRGGGGGDGGMPPR